MQCSLPLRVLPIFLCLACSDNSLVGTAPVDDGGRPQGPSIRIDPAEVSFDPVGPGCATDSLVRVTNVGSATLEVVEPVLVGDRADDYWTDATPLSLEPDASDEFTVGFTATTDGDHPGALFLASNDLERPEVQVPLLGIGTLEEWVRTDDFVQNRISAVDVLFVVDNSSSMAPEQAHVADNVAGFFQWFRELGVDYHMGVVTTDVVQPGHQGALQGSPAYIHPGVDNPEAELAEAIEVGEQDMGVESGLRAMELALSEPMLSGPNAGFYRDEAFLSIIVLTDEPEQSTADAAHYIAFLDELKGDPDRVSVSAIVGDRGRGCNGTCFGAPTGAQPGDKYIDVQEAFPGVFASICGCDFGGAMEGVGLASAGIRAVFELSSVPSDPGRIEVVIDGETNLEWTYDASANAVVFPPDAIPAGLANIFITYPVVGACD